MMKLHEKKNLFGLIVEFTFNFFHMSKRCMHMGSSHVMIYKGKWNRKVESLEWNEM